MRRVLNYCLCLATILGFCAAHADDNFTVVVKPTRSLLATPAMDQDDLCVWVDPQDSSRSIVITSDKKAGRIFVYDLNGSLRQELPIDKPGNIDLRHRVKLGDREMSVVAVTVRTNGFRLQVYRVDPMTRLLERLDSGIPTVPNYGGCMYHSPKTGRLYFITTSEDGVVGQYELTAGADGRVKGSLVREWTVGKCEGAVADDEAQTLYISEETKGVWSFGAEPDSSPQGQLLVSIGQHGIRGDMEGLAIRRTGPKTGYLIVSDQGSSRFHVFDRSSNHRHLGAFSIEGVSETDGIETVSENLGSDYPGGLFGCHSDGDRCAIVLSSWKSISDALKLPD